MYKKIVIIITVLIFGILLFILLYLHMDHFKINISNDVIKIYEEQTLYSNIGNKAPLAIKKREKKGLQ